jgi:hypothetical protein
VTVQPQASRSSSHPGGWVGFWLWALVGAGVVLAFISFVGWLFLVPAAVVAYRLVRRSRWNNGPVLFGLVAGAGLPLLLVAGLNWSDWQHRTVGDGTPNPYGWGGVGIFLLVAGVVAFAVLSRRSAQSA